MHLKRIPSIAPRLFVVVLVTILATPALSIAGKWKVKTEVQPVYYKMKSTTFDRKGKATEVVYSVDIEATDELDDQGKPLYRVKTTQERVASRRDLRGVNLAWGVWTLGAQGFAAGAQWMMFQPLLRDLELAVGEKMSYFGGMLAKVTAEATIAGQKGFVVELYRTAGEEPRLMAELVINPDLPVALRARNYDNKGKLKVENLMLEYKGR